MKKKRLYKLRAMKDTSVFGHHKKSRLVDAFDKVREASLLKGNYPFILNSVYFMNKVYNFFKEYSKSFECLDVYNFFKAILLNEESKFEKFMNANIELNDILLVKAISLGEYHYFIAVIPTEKERDVDIYQAHGNKELYKHSIPYIEFMDLLSLSENIDKNKQKIEYPVLLENLNRIYKRLYVQNIESIIENLEKVTDEEDEIPMTTEEIFKELLQIFLRKEPELDIILFRPTKEFDENDISEAFMELFKLIPKTKKQL